MERKTIWIINQYASTPETGIGGRHYHMARELAKQGHRVCLVSASFSHILRTPPECDKPYVVQHLEGFNFVWVKVPHYSGAHSKKRIFNWFLFAWKLYGLKNVLSDRPDAILCSSPSLISFLGAKRLAKFFAVPLFFEVRDIWPLTLVTVGGTSSKHPFVRFLQWVEDVAYRDSTKVISNLKYSVEHMVSRGMDREKFAWIPNGFSWDELSEPLKLSDEINSRIPKAKFIVGYTGTIGVANALESLIDAAQILKDRPGISFVIVGDGREKIKLESLVKDKELNNVHFIGTIPKVQIQSVLKQFDACYIGWRNEDLYRFGIAANKIFDYLYAGKPILHSYSGECDPIADAEAGLQVPAEDSGAIARAVLELYQMSENDRNRMGKNGHCYALEHHEYATLAAQLADVVFGEHD